MEQVEYYNTGWKHSKKSHYFTHAHTHLDVFKGFIIQGLWRIFVQQLHIKNNTIQSEKRKLTSGMVAWQMLGNMFLRVGVHPHPGVYVFAKLSADPIHF